MLYRSIIRPLLFQLNPEAIHHIVNAGLKFVYAIPGVGAMSRAYFHINDKSLETEVFGLKFPNPVGFAAGFDKEGKLYNELHNLGFGHIEIGTFTPKGQSGNPQPRLFRLIEDHGLINRMGFNNSGATVAAERLKNRKPNCIVGGNIGKNTATPNSEAVADYVSCFETLFDYVDYFVVNVSCPNVTNLHELQDRDSLLEILTAIQEKNNAKSNPKPVLLKVAPDLNDKQLDDTIEIVIKTKLAGVVATNTTITRDHLKTSQQKIESIGRGGMSGAPIKDKSTQVIRYIAKKSNKAFPIIGVGGIETPEDAMEKLDAGADLIQVYTGFIYSGPWLVRRINKAISKRNKKQLKA
ncbi:MAG: quinone-dependent dihydroorotate dehydrogenase [Bacteroidales bacterium]|nr:quinone-dependent dihydroorotate dehydrogenase [Bacteroidales bacterium]